MPKAVPLWWWESLQVMPIQLQTELEAGQLLAKMLLGSDEMWICNKNNLLRESSDV